MATEELGQARIRALSEKRLELIIQMQELCLAFARNDLEIIRAGGTFAGPIGASIGGSVAGTIGATIAGTIGATLIGPLQGGQTGGGQS